MSMVKVDGSKIKRLREEQGLTQLYLATAVQVTTDTISRWENRRYPSIKKENGMKLAEALNVSLEDLLEIIDPANEALPLPGNDSALSPLPEIKNNSLKKKWPLLFVSLVIFVLVISIIWYFLHSPAPIPFSVERILPGHCISGQPFPVLVKITGSPEKSSALIIRENLPPESIIHKISPEVSAGGQKNTTIKWLRKINGTETFAYVISITGKDEEVVQFAGTAAVSNDSDDSPAPISGDDAITIGQYHWADTDKDNVISDNEILSVYDQYREIQGIDLDIDLIEEIWLGSGYKWNANTATFEILD